MAVSRRIRIPLGEFRFTFARSSGPGGQNVNKVNSKATLHWPIVKSQNLPEPVRERFIRKYRRRVTKEGEVVISSQRYRDRQRNVEDCLEKLHGMIGSVATAPKARKATKPPPRARVQRRHDKEALSHKKRMRKGVSNEE